MDIGAGIATAGIAFSAMGVVIAAIWRVFPDKGGRSGSQSKMIDHLTGELAVARQRLDDEKNTNLWGTINDMKALLTKNDERMDKIDRRIDLLEKILIQVTTACQKCEVSSLDLPQELVQRRLGHAAGAKKE